MDSRLRASGTWDQRWGLSVVGLKIRIQELRPSAVKPTPHSLNRWRTPNPKPRSGLTLVRLCLWNLSLGIKASCSAGLAVWFMGLRTRVLKCQLHMHQAIIERDAAEKKETQTCVAHSTWVASSGQGLQHVRAASGNGASRTPYSGSCKESLNRATRVYSYPML